MYRYVHIDMKIYYEELPQKIGEAKKAHGCSLQAGDPGKWWSNSLRVQTPEKQGKQ